MSAGIHRRFLQQRGLVEDTVIHYLCNIKHCRTLVALQNQSLQPDTNIQIQTYDVKVASASPVQQTIKYYVM